ncbi:MAG: hypothetical protein HC802_11660 [Caldilineaceae bacterium]|nr:hypothetical protein [Caldilineaceae bacterium]
MASVGERAEFESWHQALLAKQLSPQQLLVLQQMVDDGDAADLEQAAQLLDWQSEVVDSTEHLYGF